MKAFHTSILYVMLATASSASIAAEGTPASNSTSVTKGEVSTMPRARAALFDAKGKEIGSADFTGAAGGVLIHLKVAGLKPGRHGLHLHAVGECRGESGFQSATGHVGHGEGLHGLLNPKQPEAGDLPNLFVAGDGIGEMEAYSTRVSLNGGGADLLDADGSALIVHEGPDDHVSQPIGGAGARVACGVVEPVRK